MNMLFSTIKIVIFCGQWHVQHYVYTCSHEQGLVEVFSHSSSSGPCLLRLGHRHVRDDGSRHVDCFATIFFSLMAWSVYMIHLYASPNPLERFFLQANFKIFQECYFGGMKDELPDFLMANAKDMVHIF